MDVRLPITTAGICLTLLLGGCSPGDEKPAVSLEEKTAQFEQSLDAITDPKLKDAVTELGGSLLLLERAQQKLDNKPPRTEYGEDALGVLRHYPTPQALVDTFINGLFFERISMGEIAKSLGTDRKGVQRIRDYALTMLRGALQEA